MADKGKVLQKPFLDYLHKEQVPVSLFLVNGIKLQGKIEAYDEDVVILQNHIRQMVYKHAISTVVPMKDIPVGKDDAMDE